MEFIDFLIGVSVWAFEVFFGSLNKLVFYVFLGILIQNIGSQKYQISFQLILGTQSITEKLKVFHKNAY